VIYYWAIGPRRMGAEGLNNRMLPEHTRSMKLFCRIDASALAGIMIVLVFTLLFPLWLAPTHHGIGADLAKVSHSVPMPRSQREDAMMITIMRDGIVYFGADKISSDQVRPKILDRLKDTSVERKIYIRADGRVWYRSVKGVLDGVRAAGIEQVAFLVDQRPAPAGVSPQAFSY
jgi:biopolymer transport protein TolR